jgi:hypothetical protein
MALSEVSYKNRVYISFFYNSDSVYLETLLPDFYLKNPHLAHSHGNV